MRFVQVLGLFTAVMVVFDVHSFEESVAWGTDLEKTARLDEEIAALERVLQQKKAKRRETQSVDEKVTGVASVGPYTAVVPKSVAPKMASLKTLSGSINHQSEQELKSLQLAEQKARNIAMKANTNTVKAIDQAGGEVLTSNEAVRKRVKASTAKTKTDQNTKGGKHWIGENAGYDASTAAEFTSMSAVVTSVLDDLGSFDPSDTYDAGGGLTMAMLPADTMLKGKCYVRWFIRHCYIGGKHWGGLAGGGNNPVPSNHYTPSGLTDLRNAIENKPGGGWRRVCPFLAYYGPGGDNENGAKTLTEYDTWQTTDHSMTSCVGYQMCKAILCKQPAITTTLGDLAPYQGTPNDKLTPWWNTNDRRCLTGPDGHGYSLSLYVECPAAEKSSQCEHVKQYDAAYCRSKKVCPSPTRFEIGEYNQWPYYPGNHPATGLPPSDLEKKLYNNPNHYWGPEGRNIAAPPYFSPYYEFGNCLTDTDPDYSTAMYWPNSANLSRRRFRSINSSPYGLPTVVAKVQEILSWNVTKAAAFEACQSLCSAA
jgi:hypothetical protein